MMEHFITTVTANDIYNRKESQMRVALLQIADWAKQNTDLIDDPNVLALVEQASDALDDLEWIDANEKAADATTSDD